MLLFFLQIEGTSLKYIKKKQFFGIKTTSKYLVYCPVFWIEIRRFQDQCISISALAFDYCIPNNLSREKTNINVAL